MTDSALRELADDPSSRKRFFKMLGGAGAVSAFSVALAACGDDKKSAKPAPVAKASADSNKSDLEILNYALTLEFLEADFYKQVIDSGMVKDPKVGSIAKKFGSTEQEHVDALTATIKQLGGKPAAAH